MASFIARTTPTTYAVCMSAFRAASRPATRAIPTSSKPACSKNHGKAHPDERVRLRVLEARLQPVPEA